MTDLPNRVSFLDHLNSEIALYQEIYARQGNSQPPQYQFAVLLLSIDRFHNIKRSLGYEISDKLLKAVSRRLEECIVDLEMNVAAKISEDEFALLITGLKNPHEVVDRAECLYRELIKPFEIDETTVISTVSIGIALNQDHNREPEKMLRWADTAMQYAKVNFAKTSVLFDATMQSKAVEKLLIENDLQRAIDNQQLYLNYQPIVSLDTGKINCLEALVRWKHDSLGIIPPDKFIPICEETGQIIALGQWVLSEACYQLVNWQKALVGDSSLTMSINLYPYSNLSSRINSSNRQPLRVFEFGRKRP
ncbi:MAG: diguanylate cyclase [Hydrococcus sp. SU_1_0]|nr:diguanylate cyclase [Hydrococcus sp. SU_1_0]